MQVLVTKGCLILEGSFSKVPFGTTWDTRCD